MNPLFQMYGQQPAMAQPQMNSPLNRMQAVMQAMTNPAEFVRRNIPDLPAEISNNPTQILQYLQQTRHISNQQIQNLLNQNPYPYR